MAGILKTSIASLAIAAAAFASGYVFAEAPQPMPSTWLTPLIVSGETVTGEKVQYPAGAPAKISAVILTLAPGQETGWHTHNVPSAGIVLEGELTVDYGEKGMRTFRQGEALIEAMVTPHKGKNTGSVPMRAFAVFMGAEGVANTVPITDKK